jgi:hypothetical protein
MNTVIKKILKDNYIVENVAEDSLNNLALMLSNSEGMEGTKEGLDMENYLFSTKMILIVFIC